MRQRSLIFVILAVFFTVGTIYFARSWLAGQRPQVAAAPAKVEALGVSVLVAARDLPTGSFIRPEDLRWQAWPEGQLADNYLLKDKDTAESLSGAVVKLRVAAGEPVTGNRVIKPGDRGFLAAVLTPGMRAVSVPVTPVSGVSGLVFPGDHVDIILAHQVKRVIPKGQDDNGDSSMFVSETIQTDIRILAIDQSLGDSEGKPVVARTVTFEVAPKQVEAIEVASMIGNFYLSLRGLATGTSAGDDGMISEDEPQQRGTRAVSYTLDSDVSLLVRHSNSQQSNVVTILRGKGGDTTTPVAPTDNASPAPSDGSSPPPSNKQPPVKQTSAP